MVFSHFDVSLPLSLPPFPISKIMSSREDWKKNKQTKRERGLGKEERKEGRGKEGRKEEGRKGGRKEGREEEGRKGERERGKEGGR